MLVMERNTRNMGIVAQNRRRESNGPDTKWVGGKQLMNSGVLHCKMSMRE